MKIIFLTSTLTAWGKGESLTEAIKNNQKALKNNKMKRGDSFQLFIYEADSIENVGFMMDGLGIFKTKKTDRQIYQGIETH